jgi:hypothetical protein
MRFLAALFLTLIALASPPIGLLEWRASGGAGSRRTQLERRARGQGDGEENLAQVAVAGLGTALDRAVGCLLGQVVGDSLGSLVEFRSPHDIARQYSDGVRISPMAGHGTRLRVSRPMTANWRSISHGPWLD